MALIPKRFKFKKYFKLRINTKKKHTQINFGNVVLKAGEPGRLTPKQIEATRKTIKKIIKPYKGIIRTKIQAFMRVSAKSLGTRMGRGKGKTAFSVCPVQQNATIFEIYCQNIPIAVEAVKAGAFKLPIKTILLKKTSSF